MASHMTNPLATSAQLARARARAPAWLSPDLLDAVFFATQCLTQAAGQLLGLPQSTAAQASVVLARYWLADPGFMGAEGDDSDDGDNDGGEDQGDPPYDYIHVSAAVLYVVAKTSAFPRSARDVANVYAYLGATRHFWGGDKAAKEAERDAASSTSPPPGFYLSENAYAAFHNRVLGLEARVLERLGFDLHVALPHPLAITYLQALDFMGQPSAKSRLGGRTVDYLNTALLSPQLLYLTHQPHELAVAAIYNAARDQGCHMPASAWWEVFDVDRETLGFVAVALRSVGSWAESLRQGDDHRELLSGGILTRRRVREEAARAQQSEADKAQQSGQADQAMEEAPQ